MAGDHGQLIRRRARPPLEITHVSAVSGRHLRDPTPPQPDVMTDSDTALLRRAFALAASGDGPFGAVIADGDTVIAEAHNETIRLDDPTAHAETLALRRAGAAARGATLFASTEPCAMCATAAQVAGIARIVFGLRERDIPAAQGGPLAWQPLPLPVTEIAARSPTPLRVEGPWLEAEAAALHARR